MSRKCKCTKQEDIPEWIVTYSDTITLLMTFFILLLTFATSEPERFQQLQSVMFGGSRATGMMGSKADANERTSLVLRQRPHSARLTLRGSEMPPLYDDAALESVSRGLAGLNDESREENLDRFEIVVSLPVLIDEDGNRSPIGQRQLTSLAKQMRRQNMSATIEVPAEDVAHATALAMFFTDEEHVIPGRISIAALPPGSDRNTHIVLSRIVSEAQ
jgi:flagellar motor protein MotB